MSKGFDEFIAEMRAKDPGFAPRKIINKLRAAWVAGKKSAEPPPCAHNWKRVASEDAFDPAYECTICGADS